MRCMTAFDQRTWPFGGDGDDRLLHGVEHGRQLVAAALDFGKVLTQAFGGLVQRGFHGGKFIATVDVETRAQVALRNASRKSDHALKPAGDVRWRPMRPAAARQPAQSARTRAPHRPDDGSVSGAECSTKRRRMSSIATVWKTKQKDKQPQQL